MKLTGDELHNTLKAALRDLCNEAAITNSLCGHQITSHEKWATLTETERHAAVQAFINEVTATKSEVLTEITRATFERAASLNNLTFVEERKLQA